MERVNVVLAVEDELSKCVGARLLEEAGAGIKRHMVLEGITELRKKLPNFLRTARRTPVFLLIDMDRPSRRQPCAPEVVRTWLGTQPRPKGFLFRVAVCEVEAWLLADHEAMYGLLGSRIKLPDFPDAIPDPKECLLKLAGRAPREVRELLTVERNAAASQGLGYNACLGKWVSESWSPARAAERSPSLKKARIRLREFCS